MNKAISLNRHINLPPLTTKDIEAIKICIDLGIKHFALSFVHYGSDVDKLRTFLTDDCNIISKIECNKGLENLKEIISKSDAILIDEGTTNKTYVKDYESKITANTGCILLIHF